jgi:polyhydroxyalkanoate synthesis regulator phasin
MATFAQRTTSLTLWGYDKASNSTTVSLDDSIASQPILKFGSGTGTSTEVLFDADNVSFLVSGSAKTLVAERSERIAAEAQNATNITTESSRALAAESVNSAALTSEATTARAAEVVNATAIASENARALAVEAATSAALAQESVDRAAGDTSVTAALEAYRVLNNGSVSTNATNIANEVTRATTAESVNAAAVTTEQSRATTAELVLQTNIDAEASNARSAEFNNTVAISAEAARATAAEDALTILVSIEEGRSMAAEAAIDAKADANATAIASIIGASPDNLNQLEELVTDYTLNGATVQSNVDALTARVALLEGWIVELAGSSSP